MYNLKKTSTKGAALKVLRPLVFFPAFLLLVLTIILNFINYEAFLKITTIAKNFMINDFGWVFSITGVISVIIMIALYFSQFGEVKLGGEDAKPLLKKTTWFAVALCTTIAAGIMFWGTAEPIYHLAYPPKSLGITPMSPQAAKYAMETMYLHWTFVPYAIYAVPTVMFAFAYYNMKRPFSVGSEIAPLISSNRQNKINGVIDAVVLFTVAAGIAASFGTAVINMGGGLNSLFGISNTKTLWVIITIIATIGFIISSGTGLMKGIRILSDINVYLYYVIIAIFLILGPTVYFCGLGTEAFGGFLNNFFSKALFTGAAAKDSWPSDWTMFYWSNWMAWAPVSAVFLARISYGYKIKEVVTMNFVIPSIFSVVWMTILSGTTINFQLTGKVDVLAIMNQQGAGAVAYAVLKQFPFSGVIIGIYLIAVIISFITATDSTTNAMASICTTGISEGSKEAPLFIKIIWGIIVGAVSLIFIIALGIDGIKMLSYLGGFPALFLGILSIISIFVVMRNPHRYDSFAAKNEKSSNCNAEENKG